MPTLSLLQSRAATVLRYAVSLALLGWLATQVNWAGFATMHTLHVPTLVGAVLLAGLAYPLQAWRWHSLLRAQEIILPAR